MKKKEFEREKKESKKLIDFITCFESRSSVALESSFADKINDSVQAVEAVWLEVEQLEKALEEKRKVLSSLVKLYHTVLKDAEKVKKRIEPKLKAEIKDELKKGKTKPIGTDDGVIVDSPIPVPTAQSKKTEEGEGQEPILQEAVHKHKKEKK